MSKIILDVQVLKHLHMVIGKKNGIRPFPTYNVNVHIHQQVLMQLLHILQTISTKNPHGNNKKATRNFQNEYTEVTRKKL